MDSGCQEAFEDLLNAGIQAEVIQGTITRKANKNGGSDEDYLGETIDGGSCKSCLLRWWSHIEHWICNGS
ncbi:hypothetical protein PVL29_009391 [Vitis rotundifolia]|uniref:Uncharacterized protein n=1 Tax=Vitis rotundifolia TaxID=103349 RepID=A0AA39A098_VITRO|nr:hypothetical protein PVL29_009391 [Vitis rotundifolia]